MPEIINNRKIFSLKEVANSIENTLAERYKSAFWIKAEMNKLNYYPRSGHCYPDLVEKKDGKVVAEIRANIWKGEFERINSQFRSVLNEPLKDGITILCLVRINFHALHGLSLNILDIDVSYALGELEKEKQECISRLKKEDIFDANKKLPFPLLPKRIALISVETSKGYADFLNILDNNPRKYGFFHMLFPALLQGEKAVPSILKQLNRIRKVIQHFDVVAIIRGGGGEVGLSHFNHYELAKTVATFPIPVLSGIGHATNETVTEMVSYKNAITPTDLADFLINKLHQVAEPLERIQERMISKSITLLKDLKNQMHYTMHLFRSSASNNMYRHRSEIKSINRQLIEDCRYFFVRQNEMIQNFQLNLPRLFSFKIQKEFNEIVNMERNISLVHPENVLKRGYSITLLNGKAIKNIHEVKEGTQISTLLLDGELKSTINTIKKK